MKRRLIIPILAAFALVAGCQGLPGRSADTAPASAPSDQTGMSDASAPVIQDSRNGPPHISTGDYLIHAPSTWKPKLSIAKCLGEIPADQICTDPYEVADTVGNNVTTLGAGQLWTALSAGVSPLWNTTNTALAVGDSTAGFSAAQTDLQAVAGTKLNAADCTGATNATPIVLTCTFSPTPVVGQVVTISGFGGAGAAAVNQTFELSLASASSVTLLNSAGTGAITLAGGLVKPINYYRQQANAAGSAVVSTNQIVYVATVGTTNGNFAWQEWAMTTGANLTNKEAQPPPTMLNRAVTNLGTKTSASSWTATLTLTLSEILMDNLATSLASSLLGSL